MPTNACIVLHACARCGAELRPQAGDCCVFCSYGSVPCPPVQQGGRCCPVDAGARTMTAATFTVRPIEPRDDAAVAAIIRAVMPEFGADGPGFALHDAEVAAMSAAYRQPRHAYFVVELDGQVCGGGGIAPLAGAGTDLCELRKMYFLPTLRGRGAGHALMARCLAAARAHAYAHCYLETLAGMDAAQALYRSSGFQRIGHALGATGHHGCNRYWLRQL